MIFLAEPELFSYELASRGVASLTIIEKDTAMYAFIKKNIEELKIKNANVIRMDVFSFLSNCNEKYDFIFAGPPYALSTIDELPKMIIEKDLIAADGYFVLEHTPRNDYDNYKNFSFKRNYGTTVFSFFASIPEEKL